MDDTQDGHVPLKVLTRMDAGPAARRSVLAYSLVCLLNAGTVYLWSTYATNVAHQLEFTQTQLALVAGAGACGLYLSGPVVGQWLKQRGPDTVFRWSSAGLASGYLLMALTYARWLPASAALMAIYFFTVGTASAGVNLAACAVNLRNYPASERGFALGTSVACVGLSAFVYSVASQLFYRRSTIHTLYGDTTADHAVLDISGNQEHRELHDAGATLQMEVVSLDTLKFLLFLAIATGGGTLWASRRVTVLGSPDYSSSDGSADDADSPEPVKKSPDAVLSTLLPAGGAPHSRSHSTQAAGARRVAPAAAQSAAAPGAPSSVLPGPATRAAARSFRLNAMVPPLLRRADILLLMAALCALCGAGLMVIGNIGALVALTTPAALHDVIPGRQALHVGTLSVCNALFRFLSGVLADAFVANAGSVSAMPLGVVGRWRRIRLRWTRALLQRSRTHVLLFGGLLMVLGQALFDPALRAAAQHGEQLATGSAVTSEAPAAVASLTLAATAIVGAGYGTLLSVAPALVTEWYGVPNYAVNWGWVSWGPAVGGQLYSLAFGLASDAYRRDAYEPSLSPVTLLHSHTEPPEAILPADSAIDRHLLRIATAAPAPTGAVNDSTVLALPALQRRGLPPASGGTSSAQNDKGPTHLVQFFRGTLLACLFGVACILGIMYLHAAPR